MSSQPNALLARWLSSAVKKMLSSSILFDLPRASRASPPTALGWGGVIAAATTLYSDPYNEVSDTLFHDAAAGGGPRAVWPDVPVEPLHNLREPVLVPARTQRVPATARRQIGFSSITVLHRFLDVWLTKGFPSACQGV